MSNINIRRVIDNIRSGTTVYTPVIELIVNAIQAMTSDQGEAGRIGVKVLRSAENTLFEQVPAVDGFSVSDNGTGFTQVNRDAFDELYTANKLSQGGKGFGRFTCLKYFDRLQVDSVFREGEALLRRTFEMGLENEIIIAETVGETDASTTGTTVTISACAPSRCRTGTSTSSRACWSRSFCRTSSTPRSLVRRSWCRRKMAPTRWCSTTTCTTATAMSQS